VRPTAFVAEPLPPAEPRLAAAACDRLAALPGAAAADALPARLAGRDTTCGLVAAEPGPATPPRRLLGRRAFTPPRTGAARAELCAAADPAAAAGSTTDVACAALLRCVSGPPKPAPPNPVRALSDRPLVTVRRALSGIVAVPAMWRVCSGGGAPAFAAGGSAVDAAPREPCCRPGCASCDTKPSVSSSSWSLS
jgi:hypothetical protein